MDSREFTDFLGELDLEEYTEQFVELGCKKVKHLKDIEKSHLVEMGMKPLEIKRFLIKQKEMFDSSSKDDSNQKSNETHKSVRVPLPSTVFGQAVTEDENKLIKKYSELYYVAPMNLKQEYNNSFILKMCSAAEWRFTNKKELLTWARAERDNRWNCHLSFAASTESLKNQSSYFKEQSILYQFEKVKAENQDILKMDDNSDLKEKKQGRVESLAVETANLQGWCEKGIKMINEKIQASTGKTSRREEATWWGNISKQANSVYAEIHKFNERIQKLKQHFVEKFGQSTSTKTSDKGRVKNVKKGTKRRSESKLTSGIKTKKVKSTQMERFLKSVQNNKRWCSAPSVCVRYRYNVELYNMF